MSIAGICFRHALKGYVIKIHNVHYHAGKQSWNSLVVGSRLQSVVYCSQRGVRCRKYLLQATLHIILLDVVMHSYTVFCSRVNALYSSASSTTVC